MVGGGVRGGVGCILWGGIDWFYYVRCMLGGFDWVGVVTGLMWFWVVCVGV